MFGNLGSMVAAAALALTATSAVAQETFPNRPITIVMPYPAGQSIDVLARALAPGLQARLGQPVIVLNRDGAAGAVGAAFAARAPADGHTILYAPALVASVLPITQPTSGLTPGSFKPVCQVFNNSMAVVVRPDSPIRDLRHLQAMARAKPREVIYGTLGTLSIPHLAMLQWSGVAGIELEQVPFRSDGAVLNEVLAGRIEVGAIVLGSAAGRNDLRVLSVFDGSRHPDWPDSSTAAEQGFDVQPASFGGLLVPAATPEDRVTLLEAACAAAARDPGHLQALRTGSQPSETYLGAAAFGRRLDGDIVQKRALLAKIKLD